MRIRNLFVCSRRAGRSNSSVMMMAEMPLNREQRLAAQQEPVVADRPYRITVHVVNASPFWGRNIHAIEEPFFSLSTQPYQIHLGLRGSAVGHAMPCPCPSHFEILRHGFCMFVTEFRVKSCIGIETVHTTRGRAEQRAKLPAMNGADLRVRSKSRLISLDPRFPDMFPVARSPQDFACSVETFFTPPTRPVES